MPERLTVVFEDEGLYRRLKMRAAADGTPIKRLIEEALRDYLGPEESGEKTFDWDAFDQWQDEVEDLNEAAEPVPLRRPLAGLAEERSKYGE